MHDASAVRGGDVVGDDDGPGVPGAPHRRVGVVVEEAVVGDPLEVPAENGAGNRRGGVGGGVVAEVLGVAADEVDREQVLGPENLGGGHGCRSTLPQHGRVGGAVRAGRHHGVRDLRPHGERKVRRQGPRGGRPGQGAHGGQTERLRLRADQRERDRDGLVLAHLVDVVVHAQLVVGQRGLVPPAVRQHPVALIGQPLIVEAFEGPDHRLHEGDVEGLVVVLEVDPACLAGDVLLPVVGVLEHGVASDLVEGRDTHLFDLTLIGDAELAFGLQLGRQAVGVPAEAAVHLLAAHGLEAREKVFRVPGQQVPVVGQPVGERRTVVEDPLGGIRAVVDRGLEGAVGVPEREHIGFDLREVRRRHDAAGLRWGTGLLAFGIRHVSPGRVGQARFSSFERTRFYPCSTRTPTPNGIRRGTTSLVSRGRNHGQPLVLRL